MQEKVRQILAEFRARLEQVILFGSQARGDAVEGSDIDGRIVLKGDVNVGDEISRCNDFTAELCLEHDVLIQKVFMSSKRFAQKMSGLLENVRREGIRLLPDS